MFDQLERMNTRPEPFGFYTARDLWTDEHTSKQMLSFHLNKSIDVASRKAAFIDRSVDWIASRFDIGAGTRVADFGCGPGLYTLKLAQRQAEVTGIDFSERSIQYAREAAAEDDLDIRYVNQDYLTFDTQDRFHLILLIMCDYCALGPSQRTSLLSRFHALLEPGGSVLLDVYSLNAFEAREETAVYEPNLLDGFWSPDRYYGFLNTFKYDKEKVVLDQYTIVEADRLRTVYNWFQYFSPEELEREFTACGLKITDVFGDVAGAPFNPEGDEFAAVASR